MSAATKKRLTAIVYRMNALCYTIRFNNPEREQHVSLEMVEKWAGEIMEALKDK